MKCLYHGNKAEIHIHRYSVCLPLRWPLRPRRLLIREHRVHWLKRATDDGQSGAIIGQCCGQWAWSNATELTIPIQSCVSLPAH